MKRRPVELSCRPGRIFWYSGESSLHRGRVGEFEDDDPFQLQSAFDQFDRAAPDQEAAAMLRNRSADRRPIGLEPGPGW
jgi:hypothetical protein